MLPFFHLLVQRLTAQSAQWVSFSEENLPVDILTNLKQRNIYTNLAEITDPNSQDKITAKVHLLLLFIFIICN